MAIKVVIAEKSTPENRELMVLHHLENTRSAYHPGYKHVLQMLDEFYIYGPNGKHLCIVSHVLGPSAVYFADNHRANEQLARSVSRQLLLAVGYLHEAGVVHGEIHLGNVLFRLPEIDKIDPDLIITRFERQLAAISQIGGGELRDRVPPYLISSTRLNRQDPGPLHEVQLIGFEEGTESQTLCFVVLCFMILCFMILKLIACVAFFIDSCPPTYRTIRTFQPPEVVFGLPITMAVDIWDLGCTVKAQGNRFQLPD